MTTLDNALNKLIRLYDGTILTYRSYIETHETVEKLIEITNHTQHRIELEYKKTKDKYEYCIYTTDETGIQVPKIIYDSINTPERISDMRY